MIAAFEPNAPIEERLVRLDVERGAHVRACRPLDVANALSDDVGRIGQPMILAPAFERQRRAVMGEQLSVEALDQRQRFEPANKVVRPGRRPACERRRRPQQQKRRDRGQRSPRPIQSR
jgi:hypothetical protein